MISGKITTHPEPTKFKGYNYSYNEEDTYPCEEYTTYGIDHWKIKDEALTTYLNDATMKGFIQGARVVRSSGTPGAGTITHIHRTHTMAWNHVNKELEPFKVTWDKTSIHTGGTFDYCVEDLKLLEPAPITNYPVKRTHNETVPNLCQSC